MTGLILPSREIIRPHPGLLAGMDGGFQSLDGFEGYKKFGSGGGGGGGLQDDVPSTCMVLEASNIESYSGSGQTWANVIASPADGSSQSAFDYYLGATGSASSDDPTFTGTAGVTGSYWAFDGGDAFGSVQTGTNLGFLANVHRTTGGSAFWVAIACRINVGSTKGIFSTQNGATAIGFRVQSASSEEIVFIQRGNTINSQYSTGYIHNATTDLLIIISADNGGGDITHWINNRTGSSSTISYSSESNPIAAGSTIGGISPSASRLPNGSRVYGVAAGNAYIDDTAAGYIFDYFNASTGITFA